MSEHAHLERRLVEGGRNALKIIAGLLDRHAESLAGESHVQVMEFLHALDEAEGKA